MIKRDGVQIMNQRTGNVTTAKETLSVLKNKKYIAPSGNEIDISIELDFAIKNSVLYKDHVDRNVHQSIIPTIEVTDETTTQAAIRLSKNKNDVVALNFASARNVGGGFLGGAIAQEEDLCRCSGLYACLKNKPMFYNNNILCDHTLYTDNIIYSPNVPFFRDDSLNFLETPYLLSIISAPAPNVRALKEEHNDVIQYTLQGRALKILSIAANHNHKTLILGAWGCGAFGNDPKMVAFIFHEVLNFIGSFDHICFAVYEKSEDKPNFNAFKKQFANFNK